MTRRAIRRVAVFVAISLSLLLLGPPAFASPGDLDTSFGGDGIVTTAVNASSDGQAGVALAANGDVLVAGTEGHADGTGTRFVVVEYTPAGNLDQHFGGGDGVATAGLGDCALAQGMALDSQGRIVVVGQLRSPCNSADTKVAVARFRADGTLDPTFGGGSGKEVFALAGSGEQGSAVAMDGHKIVVAGQVLPHNAQATDFLLLRVNEDGHLDHTFSNDGFAFVSFPGGNSVALGVAVQPDHRVVACGTTRNSQNEYQFAVARLRATGALDPTFSSDGKATVDFGSGNDECTSVLLDGGAIVLGGLDDFQVRADCALVRLTSGGHLDNSFGTNGRSTQSLSSGLDEVKGLALGGSGKIVATAVKNGMADERFAVLRYRDNGTLDPSFGTGGIVGTKINSSAAPGAVAVGAGSILVSGSTEVQGNFEIAVARYHS